MLLAAISGLPKRAGSHQCNQEDVPRLRLAALPGALPTQLAQSCAIGEAFSEGMSRAGASGCGNVDAVGRRP